MLKKWCEAKVSTYQMKISSNYHISQNIPKFDISVWYLYGVIVENLLQTIFSKVFHKQFTWYNLFYSCYGLRLIELT